MNANDVKNEFEKELAQLQLNGMMRLQDQDKKYQDELKVSFSNYENWFNIVPF